MMHSIDVDDSHMAFAVRSPMRHLSSAERKKPLPAIVTTLPPSSGPMLGCIRATEIGCKKLNWMPAPITASSPSLRTLTSTDVPM
jgi:hypothetical protein